MPHLIPELLLPPVLLAVISVIQRRYGSALGGLVAGLPVTSGPIVLLAALEHGPAFAARVAEGTLGGAAAACLLCWTYAWTATHSSPRRALLVACGVFALSAFTLKIASLGLPATVVTAGVVLIAVLRRWPAPAGTARKPGAEQSPTAGLARRMVIVTAYVVAATTLTDVVGPRATGLFSPFPVLVATQVVHTHRAAGTAAAARFLNGAVRSEFAFLTWFGVLAWLLPGSGVPAAVAAATCCAGAVQYVVMRCEPRPRQRPYGASVSRAPRSETVGDTGSGS